MIPTFLKTFESDLIKYEREIIRIKANPQKETPLNDKLGLKESKFLGVPFFPINKEYPKDKKGKPMVMVAQLNFAQIPAIKNFPTEGILQLFLSPTEWYDEDSKIIYHTEDELDKKLLTDFSFLSEGDYEEIPIFSLHHLSFEKGIDKGGSEDSQFDYLFGDLDFWDFSGTLNEEQESQFGKYFDSTGHKIGGYAEFTQTDPRDYSSSKRDDVQVLQIDVDDFIMFGDSGVGHIFINENYLIKKDFSKAYFYWDCC